MSGLLDEVDRCARAGWRGSAELTTRAKRLARIAMLVDAWQ